MCQLFRYKVMNVSISSSGFTLIELMVVMTIVCILATGVVISYTNPTAKVKSAAFSILGDINLARSEAVNRNEDVLVDFTLGTKDGYLICRDTNSDKDCNDEIADDVIKEVVFREEVQFYDCTSAPPFPVDGPTKTSAGTTLAGKNGLISVNALHDADENYMLEQVVLEANEKKPAERNEFDKEILKVDERFNLVFNVLSGNYLKIFPKKDDPSRTWYNPNHSFEDFGEEEARFAIGIIPLYFVNIQNAKASGDWTEAEDALAYIKKYQDVLASDIIPSKERIEAELWYNSLNLNFWLFQAYFSLGLVLLIMALLKIFYNKTWINRLLHVLVVLTLIAFLLHSFNLILRWYIAGHPPWSNGYEMIVFVSWGLMLFGLIFFRKSDFTLPLAGIFTGTLLFVSYLDWLSPEITNLMPVLKSYWLKIHVATIISSYAPLALSALLGLMAQVMIIARNKKNYKLLDVKIKELSYINEMSMTLGLFILSIGTFLGGIWANESWGRYWAWDPKETWALISIIVYAIVLHMRLIPKLNNDLVVNIASTFAFFSIVMTSFGVNYYLTGLHSYATGDPVPIPKFVYVCVAILLIVAVLSIWRFTRNSKRFS